MNYIQSRCYNFLKRYYKNMAGQANTNNLPNYSIHSPFWRYRQRIVNTFEYRYSLSPKITDIYWITSYVKKKLFLVFSMHFADTYTGGMWPYWYKLWWGKLSSFPDIYFLPSDTCPVRLFKLKIAQAQWLKRQLYGRKSFFMAKLMLHLDNLLVGKALLYTMSL